MKPVSSRSLASATLAVCAASPLVHGFSLNFQRRVTPQLNRRGLAVSGISLTEGYDFFKSLGADKEPSANGTIGNVKDRRYTTNITLNGKDYIVALDTGSTDLWVSPLLEDIGSFNDTKIPLELLYGDGSYGVKGTIGLAPFRLGSYEIPEQAFLHADSGSVAGISDIGIDGLLGLSFDLSTASPINQAVKTRYGPDTTWGQSVLKNIFSRDPTEPNFIAIDLARTDDLEDTAGGSFSIGEYAKSWEAVEKSPKLAQYPKDGDRWTTLLEGVSVDGHDIALASRIPDVPSGNLKALLDTGDPTAIIPTQLMDDIYSRIPGSASFLDSSGRVWLLPCNTTASVVLTFGSQTFPIHPLDLSTFSKPITVNNKPYIVCVASVMGADEWAGDDFEVSLGDSFLRNVYSVFDFGDTKPDGSFGDPYMQLLAQTDPKKAASQVATIRAKTMASLPPEMDPTELVHLLETNDPSVGPVGAAKPPSSATAIAPTSTTTKTSTNSDLEPEDGHLVAVEKYGPIVIGLLAGNMLIGIILIVLAILNYVRRGGSSKAAVRSAPHYIPVKVRDEELGSQAAYQVPYGR